MNYIADLHIHSHFSRATSKECNLPGLDRWAQIKGVAVVGTGDCTHPEWLDELKTSLEPSDSNGLYRLKSEFRRLDEVPESCRSDVKFMITGEVSSIYKRDDAVRKVHSIILFPDLESAIKVHEKLDEIGNVRSDGRPILGLDPRILLEICLEASSESMLVPAHIWTPWFSMLGSKSGFDSLEECFGDLSAHITAVETGLSSDAPMNWRVSDLDRVTLISNSDLHSPSNLGRNATVFRGTPGYSAIRATLADPTPDNFGGTIDMFPEEGKYHCDGHRKCGVCLEPEESLNHDCICPECGKPLTLGVLHRVVELADRDKNQLPDNIPPFEYIIPLNEILAGLFDCGVNTKRVRTVYNDLVQKHGPELEILRTMPPEQLDGDGVELLPEAIRRLRDGNVIRKPGFDGEYGVIRLFEDDERDKIQQAALVERARSMTARLGSRVEPLAHQTHNVESALKSPKPR